MESYLTEKIREKFHGKSLIVPAYVSAKKPFYSVEDLERFDDIEYLLGEVNDHEADITEMGIQFFGEVFGLEKLAKLLYDSHWYADEYNSPEAIYDWLKWWDSKNKKLARNISIDAATHSVD